MARKGSTKAETVTGTCPVDDCGAASDARSSQRGYCSEHFQAGQERFVAKTVKRFAETFGAKTAEAITKAAIAEAKAPKPSKQVNAKDALDALAASTGISADALLAALQGLGK